MNQSISQSNQESAPITSQMGDLAMPTAASAAAHVGQATVIEQSRAAAEVQSAVVVAQRFPRNERHALGRIIAACNRLSLAREAFYSFPRGNETVTGASIKLAKEMARSWGNIQHEIVELSQDTKRGESEVMAYAWDLETNTRSAIRFIVPHKRHTRQGVKTLTDPRDIYELIANNGSRRLRQCIFAIMPADLVTEAERVCRETLQKGDGKPLSVRITSCIAAFGKVGVTREMLTEKIGYEPEKMSLNDLTDLQIIFHSIKAGESIDAFFTVESSLVKPQETDNAPSEKQAPKKTRQTRKQKTETETKTKADEPDTSAASEQQSQPVEPEAAKESTATVAAVDDNDSDDLF